MDPRFAVLAGIVLLAYTAEAVSGFGSIVIAVTLGAHLYAIPDLLPLLVPLNLVLSTYIVSRHRDGIDGRLLSTRVLPAMGVGLAAGLALFHSAPGGILRSAFAVLIVVLAVRELRGLLRPKSAPPPPPTPAASIAWMILAGLIHGVYASGGPPLVYALGRLKLPKRTFRSTLSTVWLVLNAVLAVSYVAAGRYDAAVLGRIAVLLPIVPLGIFIGEHLHDRIDEERFRILVFAMLLVAGVALLVR